MGRGCSCQGMPSPPAASPGCVGSAACRFCSLPRSETKFLAVPTEQSHVLSPHPSPSVTPKPTFPWPRVSWEGAGFSQSSGCPPAHTIPTASTPVGAAAPGSAGMSSGMWVGSGKKGAGEWKMLGPGEAKEREEGGVQWTQRQQGARGSGAAAEPGDKVTAILPALEAINRDNWE